MKFDHEAILREFIAEAQDNLATAEDALLTLEHARDKKDAIAEVFRAVHNLKGNATVLGLDALAEFSHHLEDQVESLRSGQTRATHAVVTALLGAIDVLGEMVVQAENPAQEQEATSYTTAIDAVRQALAQQDGISDEPQMGETDQHKPATSGATGQGRTTVNTGTVRISIERLDRLLNLAGEITVSRGRMRQLLTRGATDGELLAAHSEADDLLLDLQDHIMQLRMVAVGSVFRPFTRLVRDMAESAGKDIQFHMIGEEVEVDMTILEHLKNPLTHMVRNAVDHGIEDAAERTRLGKPASGSVTVRAAHDSGNILIEISDDGAGMDPDTIRAKAKRLGRATGHLSDEQVLSLVFEAGFSTREQVTEISGRGVGMDVVKQAVELLRGSISVTSKKQKGTTVSLRLPLTLAMVEGFAVASSEEVYVLPLDCVVECMELPLEVRPDQDDLYGVVNLRGTPLPYVRLRRLFDLSDAPAQRESIVVVEQNHSRAGLVVDELLGEMQTVIKPLGQLFKHHPTFAASTLLGNGRVALVLDIGHLLQQALRHDQAQID